MDQQLPGVALPALCCCLGWYDVPVPCERSGVAFEAAQDSPAPLPPMFCKALRRQGNWHHNIAVLGGSCAPPAHAECGPGTRWAKFSGWKPTSLSQQAPSLAACPLPLLTLFPV